MLKKSMFSLAALALLSTLIQPVQAAPAYPYPVILVPGLAGGLPTIRPVFDRLREEGHRVLYFKDFDGITSNEETANILATKVRQTSRFFQSKVNIACFSAGVVSCRYAMKYLDIQPLVDRAVLYAGGNGAKPMCLLPIELGGDNCPTEPFAIKLELGDDTPGDSKYSLITSFTEIFTPIPDGGICYKFIPPDDFIHPFEPFQKAYQDAIAAAMSGTCPGEFVDLPITNGFF